MQRPGIQFLGVLLALACGCASAQNVKAPKNASAQAGALVTSVRVVHEGGFPAVEIVSSQPVTPTIQMLDSPPRLVIDLANAHMGLQKKRIPVTQENILTIRAEQYQIEPPMMRIVVDLLVPLGYSWDAAGNRLMVRLKGPEDPNADKTAAVPAAKELGLRGSGATLVPVNGVGEAVLDGNGTAAGSSLTAGSDTLVLRLGRGGEVRVCPGSTVSVTPSKTSKDMIVGMNTGGIETHYTLGLVADTVLTPDFRIVFAGPGEFHFAVSTDAQGNTCVRGLKGNGAAAMVSELIGDRTYQVKPREQAVFRGGRLDKIDGDVPAECGCPAPVAVPVMRADAGAAAQPDAKNLSNGPETQPLPPSNPNDVHVQVEAPLVYRGGQKAAIAPKEVTPPVAEPSAAASPAPAGKAEAEVQAPAATPPVVSPPPPPQKPAPRGFFGRIKGFFGAMFR